MRFDDVLKSAWGGVKSRKFRFALNLIGILIGCAAVTGLVSLTQGLSDNISSQLGTLGASTITVSPGGDSGFAAVAGGGQGFGGASTRTLDYRDVKQLSKINDVAAVVPVDSGGSVSYTLNGNTYAHSVTGTTDEYFGVNKSLEVVDGRPLLRSDSGVAVIGALIAQPEGEASPILSVGDRLKVTASVNGEQKEMTFRIVGLLKETGGSFGSSDNSILISIADFDQFFEKGGKYSSIQVEASSPDLIDSVSASIKSTLKDVSVLTASGAQSVVSGVTGTIQAVLGGIAAISLVVAGIGIINTMTISVLERTREIGVLKALGMKSRDVLVLFLSEAVLTGIVGGVIGAAFGFVISSFVGSIIGLTPTISIYLGVLVVGFSVATCVISGLYPAWNASRMNPVEALRHE